MDNYSKSELQEQTRLILQDIFEQANLTPDDIFVVGLSTSEVIGGVIGENSSIAVARVIIKEIHHWCQDHRLNLATQGCEHLNRALVVERAVAIQNRLEIVDVLPSIHAGGSGQIATFELLNDPVEVEFITAKAGIDIGDTAIGMQVKHVQIPLKLKLRTIGSAHVTALTSRPKKIGGERAHYGKWTGINAEEE